MVVCVGCGGDSEGGGAPVDAGPPDAPAPDSASPDAVAPDAEPPSNLCDDVVVTAGSSAWSMIVSSFAIGMQADGYDLDGDGLPDNRLAAISTLATSGIDDAFAAYDFIVVWEMFGDPAVGDSVAVAQYAGFYRLDADADGAFTATLGAGADCNDHVAAVRPGAAEIPGNRVDDDCDGFADETAGGPSTDDTDVDMDGVSLAAGDCDDTRAAVAGGAEVCGDGLDNDCDGAADTGACTPYDEAPDTIAIDAAYVGAGGCPVYGYAAVQPAGTALHGQGGRLLFYLPVQADVWLAVPLSSAVIDAEWSGAAMTGVRVGGVMAARDLDRFSAPEIEEIGLTSEHTLADAYFANILEALLGLPESPHDAFRCHSPDIDVDGDGLESFCDSNPFDDDHIVDVCIDGDGTVVTDGDAPCTEAVDVHGVPMFVDGISVAFLLETVPAVLVTESPTRGRARRRSTSRTTRP